MAKPKDKEEVILAAAIDLFLQNGFSNTSMKEIAVAAGVGKGTLYEYFPDKDHLFIEALKFYMLNNLQRLKEVLSGKHGFREMLEGYIEFHLEVIEADAPKIETIMFKDNLQMKPGSKAVLKDFIEDFDEKHVALLKGIWQQGIQEGLVKTTINQEFTATIFLEMVIKCGLKYSLWNKGQYSRELMKQHLISLLIDGIGVPK